MVAQDVLRNISTSHMECEGLPDLVQSRFFLGCAAIDKLGLFGTCAILCNVFCGSAQVCLFSTLYTQMRSVPSVSVCPLTSTLDYDRIGLALNLCC